MTSAHGRRRCADAAACAALGVLWAAFWWPIVSGAERLFVRDFSLYGLAAKYYWRERVTSGELPAWIASIDAGSPFLADVGYQALYPPNLLFLIDMPISAGLSWFMALHYLAGMLGMYALARVLGAWPLLAVWAGAAYGLAGYPLGIADNITYIAGVAWAPGVLAAFIASLRHGSLRLQVVAALLLAFILLTGDLLDAAAVVSVCGVHALYRIVRAWRETGRRRAFALGLLAAVMPMLAVLLAGAQILPTLELLSLSERAEPMAAARRMRWSLPPLRLVELLHPYVFGVKWPRPDFLAPSLYPAAGSPWSESIYLGPVFVASALAALALRPRAALGWALLVAGALLFATTGHFPALLDITAQLPVLGRQRYFEKLTLWAVIGLLALAVTGARALLDPRHEPMPRNATARLVLAALVVLGLWLTLDMAFKALPADRLAEASAFWSSRLPLAVTHVGGSIAHAVFWMVLLAACVLLRGRWRRALLCVALVVSLADLFWLHYGRYIAAPAELVTDDNTPAAVDEILAIDRDGLREGRVFYDHAVPGDKLWLLDSFVHDRVKATWAATDQPGTRNYLDIYNVIFLKERLTPNYGILHGVRYFNGDWSPLRSLAIHRLEMKLLDEDPGLLLALGGVRWVVSAIEPRNYVWENAGFEEVAARPDLNLLLLRAPRAAPRAWLSSRTEVTTPAHDYLQPAGGVRVLEEAPERLRISLDAGPAARWLVVSESLLPGWAARVDGKPVPITAAHGRYIGVPVAAGAHEVTLEYRVPGFAAGATLSLAGMLLALLALVVSPRVAKRLTGDARAQ